MKFVVQQNAKTIRITDERFYLILLGLLAAGTAALMTGFALSLHRNFLTIACDTAVLQSAIVNTIQGNWFANNGPGGPNILASHTTFLLLLLIPIYVMAPSADTLFTLQVWGVFSTVIPIYLVAQELLRRPQLAFCIAAGTMISPLLFSMALAPFHLETWIVASSFWAYYFYRRNNLVGFCVSLLVAVSCGEQAALIFISLGASMLLIDDGLAWRRRFGPVSVLAGFTWILFAIFIVEPLTRTNAQGFNIFAYNYAQWHVKSFSELPLAVAQDPGTAASLLFSPHRWEHLVEIVGLPLLCVFLSWRSLILLAPFPVYFLMSNQEFLLYFHSYYFSFAFVAGVLGLLFFISRFATNPRLIIGVMAAFIFVNVLLLCTTTAYYINLASCRDDIFTATLRKAFSEIPVEAAVYTPHRYSAYLSNRENMVIGDVKDEHFDFDIMMDARYRETNVHPEQIDYIVADCIADQCGCRQGGYNADIAQRRADNIKALAKSGQWKIIFSDKNACILQRVKL